MYIAYIASHWINKLVNGTLDQVLVIMPSQRLYARTTFTEETEKFMEKPLYLPLQRKSAVNDEE